MAHHFTLRLTAKNKKGKNAKYCKGHGTAGAAGTTTSENCPRAS